MHVKYASVSLIWIHPELINITKLCQAFVFALISESLKDLYIQEKLAVRKHFVVLLTTLLCLKLFFQVANFKVIHSWYQGAFYLNPEVKVQLQ